jgi:hypothetical protein
LVFGLGKKKSRTEVRDFFILACITAFLQGDFESQTASRARLDIR